MRKALLVLVAGVLLISATWLAGCGKTSVQIDTGKNKLEVSTPGGSVKLGAPTEAELGVSIYPGAKLNKNAAGTYTQGDQTIAAASYTTDDSVDKVVAWYKGKLSGKPQFTDLSTPQGGMLSFQSGDETKSILIAPSSEFQGKTGIVIMSGTGIMPQGTL